MAKGKMAYGSSEDKMSKFGKEVSPKKAVKKEEPKKKKMMKKKK